MNLVDHANRQRSLTAMSRTLRSGRIAANAGVPTSTYSYDANGNLTSGAGWGYTWDYLNRMLSAGFGNSTTTYAYDAGGSRVLQTSTTSTTFYPNKFYSFASTLIGATTYATSTNYIWNGDTLLATIDQKLINGTATGTPSTRYIHPDHLGSTNAVTDQNGNVVQLLDYFPYGATRISTSTYPTNEKRQFIGQYYDVGTNLDYLNARYYSGVTGQFLSEDPAFLAVGDQNLLRQLTQNQAKLLSDPQQLNPYIYSRDNPVTNKDPEGLWAVRFGIAGTIPGWGLTGELGVQADLQGVEYYYGGGLAGGGGISFGPQITTANLSHQYSITTSAFGQGGALVSVEVSKGMTYYPYSNRKREVSQEASYGFPAVELAGGGMAEVSGPIPFLTWSSPQSSTNYSLPEPQMVSNVHVSGTQVSSSQNLRSGGASYGQVLSSLQSALQKLSAVLSTYKNTTSH